MILCLSPDFLDSEWGAAERSAMQFADPANRERSLIPVRFKRCGLPKGLAHLKYIDYLRHSDKAVDDLVAALPIEPSLSAATPPSAVSLLLDEADDLERASSYVAAASKTIEALRLAETAGESEDAALDLARARTAHGHALLVCERDAEEAWRLATAGADATILEAYPERLFQALITKAEAALVTGRFQIARGCADAAAAVADGQSDERSLLQIRGHIALETGKHKEAATLYEEAAQSFLAQMSADPDEAKRTRAMIGVGSCLTNKALALRHEGRIADARIAFQRAADWFADGGSPADESIARLHVARCFFDDQEWPPGFAALDAAERLAEQEKLEPGLVDCLELRARALASTDEPGPARDVLSRALTCVASDSQRRRRFHQMLATLSDQLDDVGEARRHLGAARILAEQAEDRLVLADVEEQTKRLGSPRQSRSEPASEELIAALMRRLEVTERPIDAAHTMQQLAGAYRSQRDLTRAAEWFRRAHDAATVASDSALAAAALIGLAELAITDEDDVIASDYLKQASDLVTGIPAWEVHASILTFVARIQARAGDWRTALKTLEDANELAERHHLDSVGDEISDLREDLEDWLSVRALPTIGLPALADEVARLEDWYPEARKGLRRLWWYWRGDDVIRNLMAESGAKSLLASDDPREVAELDRDLAVMFDTTTFITESSFATGESSDAFVPFPTDVAFPYVNYFFVRREQGA